jgi:hypothetical protein
LYQLIVDAGIARELPEEEWYFVDKDGDRIKQETAYGPWTNVDTAVVSKDGPFGKIVKHEILYPEYVLMADEMGLNLNMKSASLTMQNGKEVPSRMCPTRMPPEYPEICDSCIQYLAPGMSMEGRPICEFMGKESQRL